MRRKTTLAGVSVAVLAACVGMGAGSANAASFTVDPAALTLGYMNVSELPANGGGYDFGSSWGVPDLESSFSGTTVTVAPNTSIDRDAHTDTYWWQDASGTSPGNKIMDASLYAESDAIAGTTVNFTGTVLSNTLVNPYSTTIFIKDFASDYSSFTSTTVPATVGNYSISLVTTPGTHVQYGFETVGPDARLGNADGSVVIAATAPVPEPMTLGLAAVLGAPALLRRRRA